MDKEEIQQKLSEIEAMKNEKTGMSWVIAVVGWLITDRYSQLTKELKSKL